MSQANTSNFILWEAIASLQDNFENIIDTIDRESQLAIEKSIFHTGKTLQWIAANPLLKSADRIVGLDWLMTFLGKVNREDIKARVAQIQLQYPDELPHQIANRLILQKTIAAGRVGLLTNIVPPVAALLLGIELIATTKLQTEMVYAIAAAYGLDLDNPSRRGEVLAIFGLSLGADVVKTGLNIIEMIPGIGAVVGASTNAAILFTLGKTACRFYERKLSQAEVSALQQDIDTDWQIALEQSRVMDRILAYMVRITYSEHEWTEILHQVKAISPASVANIALNVEKNTDLSLLLEQLAPEFAPLTLNRCYDIASSHGEITAKEAAVLAQIATKFGLEIPVSQVKS